MLRKNCSLSPSPPAQDDFIFERVLNGSKREKWSRNDADDGGPGASISDSPFLPLQASRLPVSWPLGFRLGVVPQSPGFMRSLPGY